MARKKPGIYVPLSAYYFDDAAIMDVGEDAELLYVRILAYAARQIEREGFIPEQVVLSRLGILPRTGNGGGIETGTDAGSRAGRLVESGLLEKVDGGYRIKSWLKWNRSASEADAIREYDRGRKANDYASQTGTETGTETGTRPGSADQIQIQKQKHIQRQIETDFESWYEHYPKKVGRGDALKAFKTARKKIDLETLIEATKRYAQSVQGQDRKFIKNPGPWLRDERWADDTGSASAGKRWDPWEQVVQ